MIFVPFTGVDHHKRCVTFAAALLYDETIESYTWLLERFLEAHHTQPRLVLTDQDPAMKQAVSKVFNESVHRLCMWHVIYKLPAKVCIYVICLIFFYYVCNCLFYVYVMSIDNCLKLMYTRISCPFVLLIIHLFI